MQVGNEHERDPFELFGDLEQDDATSAEDFGSTLADQIAAEAEADFEDAAEAEAGPEPADEIEDSAEDVAEDTDDEADAPAKLKTGFSWAGFMGGLAALVWVGGAIAGPLSYFGVNHMMSLDPAMQVGWVALAFGPALLFWVAASAAGEALKARRIATELAYMAQETRAPFAAESNGVQRLTDTVRGEIETLNDAVAAALDRMAQLESAAQRNAALFNDAVLASRGAAETMSDTLQRERDALAGITTDMRDQTETMANAVGRQVRLMREASKLVKTELGAAEDALETHLSSFAQAASLVGDRTADFHAAADGAAAATASLNTTMHAMLEGLGEATRLTDAARQSADQALVAANETATAVRETTRGAVFEAKRAAQLIRAENAAMQEAANDTLSKLREAAQSAREASEASQSAAERHAAEIERRLGAVATAVAAKRAAAPRIEPQPTARPYVERSVDRRAERRAPEPTTLEAAARVAAGRSAPRTPDRQHDRHADRHAAWGSFIPTTPPRSAPAPANERFADFGDLSDEPLVDDEALKHRALDLVTDAGVDLDEVLRPPALERIALSARQGAMARRRAVADMAPQAVNRIARHMQRNPGAQSVAKEFRARPDLTKGERKRENSELVRAYLLIDAALS